jgi:hypothetical protein
MKPRHYKVWGFRCLHNAIQKWVDRGNDRGLAETHCYESGGWLVVKMTLSCVAK